MNNAVSKKRLIWTAAALAAATAGYALILRPKHLHWGATKREAAGYLVGDEFLPEAESVATHAITIDAPKEDVWPWLAQLGQDKAGFYSYTVLENLVGCHMHNALEIHSEWQELKQGDEVRFHPDFPPVPVVLLKKEEYLVMGAELNGKNPSTWTFVLRDLGFGKTRLIVRLRGRAHRGIGRAADLVLLEPAHFVMERKMLLNIKKLAEGRARALRESVPVAV
jgi:hypothetical protein